MDLQPYTGPTLNLNINSPTVQENTNTMIQRQRANMMNQKVTCVEPSGLLELQKQNDALQEQLTILQKELYESKKINAQIDTLNKTIDMQDSELTHLREINQQVKDINHSLQDDVKHYKKTTIYYPLMVGFLLLIIEHWKDILTFILSL